MKKDPAKCQSQRSFSGLILNSGPPDYEAEIKVKVIPQQAEVAQGVPGRLRPRIFLTFGTTRVVGRQHRPPLPQNKSLVLIFRG